jgi:hypothetical protein
LGYYSGFAQFMDLACPRFWPPWFLWGGGLGTCALPLLELKISLLLLSATTHAIVYISTVTGSVLTTLLRENRKQSPRVGTL